MAVAPFHVMPEVGFFVGPRLAVSAYARVGFPLGANLPGRATAAPAGFVRMAYGTRPGGDGVRFHGDVGVGFIRHIIPLDSPPPDVMGDTDTFATGPLFVGGGIGIFTSLGGAARFVFDTNLLLGLPATELGGVKSHLAAHVDVSLGVAFAF
ncbi:MAG: hypothetical protein EXR73_10775 [Myxococcales bacterium]|nr:hypothetical protein [Myxococcales bacterium]